MSLSATPPANACRLASLARRMARKCRNPAPFSAVLMTDRLRLPDPVAAAQFLPQGAAIILRDYGPQTEKIGAALAALCRRRGLFFLIANDWRMAARLGADGLHLSEAFARSRCLAPILGWRRREQNILSIAAHSPRALARARFMGADLAILAPVLPTKSHPGGGTIGPLRAANWIARAGGPVLVLGGISAQTASRLLPCGAAGLAAIGGWTE